jgi:hypothetical protein
MRRTIALLVLGAGLLGCGDGPTESVPEPLPTFEQVYGAMDRVSGAVGHPTLLLFAPDSLALTLAQRQQMRAALDAFMTEATPQFTALSRLIEEIGVRDPMQLTREQSEAFLRRAVPILRALEPAMARYQRDVEAILTPAQRAWLQERVSLTIPGRPRPLTP